MTLNDYSKEPVRGEYIDYNSTVSAQAELAAECLFLPNRLTGMIAAPQFMADVLHGATFMVQDIIHPDMAFLRFLRDTAILYSFEIA